MIVGLIARSDIPSDNESLLWTSINFDRRVRGIMGGSMWARYLPGGTVRAVSAIVGCHTGTRSYFMEMEVIDDPVTGFPEVTGRLFDQRRRYAVDGDQHIGRESGRRSTGNVWHGRCHRLGRQGHNH